MIETEKRFIADFFLANREFFAAPLLQGERFSRWAAQNPHMSQFSQDLKNAIKGDIIEFSNAIVNKGTTLCEDCLVAGDATKLISFLEKYPQLAEVMHRNINNPAIKAWYDTQATNEQYTVYCVELTAFEKKYIIEPQRTIDEIITECKSYKAHLEERIFSQAKTVTDFEELRSNKEKYVEKVIKTANSGRTLNLDITNKKCIHTSEMNPELYLTIKKYNLIQEYINSLSDKLDDKKILPYQRLQDFKLKFSEVETQDLLKKHVDSAGIRFLTSIVNILSLTLISKIKNNTSLFWKARGEISVDNIQAKLAAAVKNDEPVEQQVTPTFYP